MATLARLRILAVVTAFVAGIGALVAPSLGQPELANPLVTVGVVFFAFWFVLFIRSRIPT